MTVRRRRLEYISDEIVTVYTKIVDLEKSVKRIEERLLRLEHLSDLEKHRKEIVDSIASRVIDEVIKRISSESGPTTPTTKRLGLV